MKYFFLPFSTLADGENYCKEEKNVCSQKFLHFFTPEMTLELSNKFCVQEASVVWVWETKVSVNNVYDRTAGAGVMKEHNNYNG